MAWSQLNKIVKFLVFYCVRSPLLTATRLIFDFGYLDDSVHQIFCLKIFKQFFNQLKIGFPNLWKITYLSIIIYSM